MKMLSTSLPNLKKSQIFKNWGQGDPPFLLRYVVTYSVGLHFMKFH